LLNANTLQKPAVLRLLIRQINIKMRFAKKCYGLGMCPRSWRLGLATERLGLGLGRKRLGGRHWRCHASDT